MRIVVLAFVVLAVAAGVNAALGATQLPHSPFHGKKTLVLLDTMEEKQAFSIYFSALESTYTKRRKSPYLSTARFFLSTNVLWRKGLWGREWGCGGGGRWVRMERMRWIVKGVRRVRVSGGERRGSERRR